MQPTLRILFVDDEETFLHSTSELLRREGFDCDPVVEVTEATRRLDASDYDLVIADINMPGNLNLEFVNRLAGRKDRLPVILVTGHPSMSSAIQSIELRVVAYLVKPFDFSELLDKVRATARRVVLLRAMRDELERLKAHRRSLRRAQDHLLQSTSTTDAAALEAFVGTAMRNVFEALMNLQAILEDTRQADPDAVLQNWPMPQAADVREVLYEAILTLERTKTAFKSKELAQLRQKLESVLEH